MGHRSIRKPKYLRDEAPPQVPRRTGAPGPIKLRLDARTIVTVSTMRAVGMWRAQYPNLIIIEHHEQDRT